MLLSTVIYRLFAIRFQEQNPHFRFNNNHLRYFAEKLTSSSTVPAAVVLKSVFLSQIYILHSVVSLNGIDSCLHLIIPSQCLNKLYTPMLTYTQRNTGNSLYRAVNSAKTSYNNLFSQYFSLCLRFL